VFEQHFLNYPKKITVNENMRNKIRHSFFRYYENKTKSLALMEAASSYRYSVQQEDLFLKTPIVLLLKKLPLAKPFITL
jgi:hypothetical protein